MNERTVHPQLPQTAKDETVEQQLPHLVEGLGDNRDGTFIVHAVVLLNFAVMQLQFLEISFVECRVIVKG